jgi:hypothetical protein
MMTSNGEQAGAFELSEPPTHTSRSSGSPPTAAIKDSEASVDIKHFSMSPLNIQASHSHLPGMFYRSFHSLWNPLRLWCISRTLRTTVPSTK